MSMILDNPQVTKTLQDYDIIYENGMVLPLTIDLAAGDTIDIGEKVISAHLVSKQSQNDPLKTLPEEHITVFISKVASIQHRSRVVVEQTQTQKEDWAKVYKGYSEATRIM